MVGILGFGLFGFRDQTITVEEYSVPWGASIEVDQKYQPLVERLQAYAEQRPDRYRRRVLFAAMIGYGFIGLVLLLLMTCVAAIVGVMVASKNINAVEIKLLLVVGVIVWAILRALWVRTNPPEGREVTIAEAPALFALIDNVRQKLRGPVIDKVLVTSDFNAAIVQHAQLGIFGWYRNYLILGLPLLQGLTEAEVTAVIAHEYGHLTGAHGRFATSIYRVRTVWAQLSANLQSGHAANLLRRFFNWYGPWFNAYSFVLARAQEYDADRASAIVTNAKTAASALVRVQLQANRFSNTHWQGIWQQADTQPRPDRLPYSSAGGYLQSPEVDAAQQIALQAALTQTTGLRDTHPCLADRLRALGETGHVPLPLDDRGADRLLGPLADRIAAEFDEQWWAQAQEHWSSYHQHRMSEAEELAALDAKADSETLDVDTQYRRAQLTEELRGIDVALPIYEALYASDSELHGVGYAIGRLRLAKGDADGIPLIEKAMDHAPNLVAPGCTEIIAFLEKHDDRNRIPPYMDRLCAHQERERLAYQERNRLSPDAVLTSPAYTAEQLAWLHDRFDEMPGIKTVHVGFRRLQYDSDHQQVVFLKVQRGAAAQQVLDAVVGIVSNLGQVIAVSVGADTRWLEKRIKKLENSLVYQHR